VKFLLKNFLSVRRGGQLAVERFKIDEKKI
jgi:hypothetical protein